MTREEWLNAVAIHMFPWFIEMGFEVPDIRVSVGFPSSGQRGRAIGECWSSACSGDGVFDIFIHPALDDKLRVAGVLAHEVRRANLLRGP